MRDLYLRFADADEMRLKLIDFGFQDDDSKGLYHPAIRLDVVGVITTSVGEGESIEYVEEPGYHVNLRVTDDGLNPSALDNFTVTPKTPARVWA